MRLIIKILFFLICSAVLILVVSALFVVRPFAFARPDNSGIAKVDQAALNQHVVKLSTDFSPRDFLNIKNLSNAADYIEGEFLKYNKNVNRQTFNNGDNIYSNVISNYGDKDGARVIVGAHYDAYGPFAGADDNASGVAGLLELGRLLKSSGLNIPISLIAYSLEEPPYFATQQMGSAVHARSLREANSSVQIMISLEMIGYTSDDEGSQLYPVPLLNYLYPSKGNFIAIVDRLNFNLNTVRIKNSFLKCSSVPVVSINAPDILHGVDFSDHRNYWANDFDAVMVTDTAFLRNFNYHTELDTVDTLNFEWMAEVVRGVYCYLMLLNEKL